MKWRQLLVILAIPSFLAASFLAAWFFFLRDRKPDFDKVGGTVLVYDIQSRQVPNELTEDVAPMMAKSIQNRLDPNARGDATVKSAGKNRIEIRIPRTSEQHKEDVERARELLARSGSLEFRIVANRFDDKQAIEEMQAFLNTAEANPQLKKEMEELQSAGMPPPTLLKADTKEAKTFEINLPGGKSTVGYSWVELGAQERQTLHLHNDAANDPGKDKPWAFLAAHRNTACQILVDEGGDSMMMQGALFFSRECKDRNLSEEARGTKKFEYFILARNPEIDRATNKETPKLDGSYLVSALKQADGSGRPALSFAMNATGGELLRNLSRKNVPTGPKGNEVKRHLAIMLDDLVMSAPTINSEIGTHGQITGNFTDREIEQLVIILRAGAMPSELRLVPVSQTEVAPKK